MWTTMASLGKTKWECSVILFLVPCFSSWCLWAEMWHYTELPPACSVQCIIPCCFGGELFAVKWMLRNGIAIYGNRAFLCTVSSLPFPLNDICNEEGRIELFAPNREEGLDGFVHQQHERHKGAFILQSLVSLPWKSVKWLQVIGMWQQVKPDHCGWEVHNNVQSISWSMPGPMSRTSLRSPTGRKQPLCSLFSLLR